MTDTFAEQIVKKTSTSSDALKKTMLMASGGVITALLVFLCLKTPFAILLIAGVIYLLYYLLTSMNVEYEYSVTNGTLDIDKIIARRKRVNMLSVEVKTFTAFDSYLSFDGDFSGTTIMAVGSDIASGEEEAPFYAAFKHETYGDVMLVFSPDEKILECIRPYLPRNI